MIHKQWKIIVLGGTVFLWLCVVCIGFELFFTVTGRYKVSGVVYDKTLGWRLKKNYYYKKIVQQNPQKINSFSTNSRGFRDREHTFSKDDNIQRVMFLGDSYTVGSNISDEYIFTNMFARMINSDRNAIGYEVMNVAVHAWSGDQQLIYLQEEGMRYKPDYVFLMIAPNDIRESYVKKFLSIDDDHTLQIHGAPVIPWMTRVCWFLSNNSRLFQFFQKKVFKSHYGDFRNIFTLFPVTFEIAGHHNSDKPLFLHDTPAVVQKAQHLFKSIILAMNTLCIENECTLVLVMLPTKMEFDGQLGDDGHQPGKIAQFMRGIAQENNIPFLDLFSVLQKEKNPLRIFLSDDYHFNNNGHLFFAEEVYEFIKKVNSGSI